MKALARLFRGFFRIRDTQTSPKDAVNISCGIRVIKSSEGRSLFP